MVVQFPLFVETFFANFAEKHFDGFRRVIHVLHVFAKVLGTFEGLRNEESFN
jgi:hypothetical protein